MATLALEAGDAGPRHGEGNGIGKGVIGPNAVTRLAEALRTLEGDAACQTVFAAANASHHLATAPSAMVDERDVARLHLALRQRLGPDRAAMISTEAGRLTAAYLLANRIPALAQRLLRWLPRRLAALVMVKAIARHAWTFAGSGRFSYRLGHHLELTLAGGPVASLIAADAPVCHYYAATFEGVFAAILGPTVTVHETECAATGHAACRFHLRW